MAHVQNMSRFQVMTRLAVPAILEQILATMVSYVDVAMVGALGANGTAAVSATAAPLWLIQGILQGVGVGYSVQVSNAVGARDPDRVKRVIRQSLLGALICGLVSMLLYESLSGLIPVWLHVKPDVLPHSVNYLRIYCSVLPFLALSSVFAAVLRCMGNARLPLLFNGLANLFNVVMNFFLIYPSGEFMGIWLPRAGWGVEGAAVATAMAIVISGGLCGIFAFRQPGFRTSVREGIRPDWMVIRRTVQLGLPSALERATINMGQIVTTGLVANLSNVALAANQIATTAEGLCYLPAYGIGYAAIALVGQAVGAREKNDAKAYGDLTSRMGFCLCLCTGTLLFLFAPQLAGLFNTDMRVVGAAAHVLRIVAFAEPFFAVSIILSNALRGAFDVRYPMFVGLLCMWVVRVPLSCLLVLKLNWGLAGVWAAMSLDLILRGILCTARWKRGNWLVLSGLLEPDPDL